MNYPLPAPLARLFANVSTSYKFFWFLAILEEVGEAPGQVIGFKRLFAQMMTKVWYPVHYFKLSFGKQDMLGTHAAALLELDPATFTLDMAPEALLEALMTHPDRQVERMLFHFQKEVPYRFLTAWLGADHTNPQIARQAQAFTADCLYRLELGGEKAIVLNPSWQAYLFAHKAILQDYTYWHLLRYLQKRNPNVPDVAHKLIKPRQRAPLTAQRHLWNLYLDEVGEMPCLYTGRVLRKGVFDLDHFIPWSFLPHDQLWNLIPGDGAVNSQKSNQLPDMEHYLLPFAAIQQAALRVFYAKKPGSHLLEDYLQLHPSLPDLLALPLPDFAQRYRDVLSPLVQIARNTGFRDGWRYAGG